MDHFLYLAQALMVATLRTPAWRTADKGLPCSVVDIFNLAKPYDEKRKEEDSYYFMVSAEGAIAISTGPEYMLRWLFLPMEAGAERDALLKQVAEEYDRVEAELQAEQTADAKTVCPHCGAALKNPNAKFCGSCGQPLK